MPKLKNGQNHQKYPERAPQDVGGQPIRDQRPQHGKGQRGHDHPADPLRFEKVVVRVHPQRAYAHGEKGKEICRLSDFLFHPADENEEGNGDGSAAHAHPRGNSAQYSE